MAKVTHWQCRTETKQGSEVTVGEFFNLICSGEPNQLNKEKLSLRRPKETPYALKIIKADSLSESSLEFTVTSYVAAAKGPLEVVAYAITDGENTIEFDKFNVYTKSVIAPESNPEGKPYPAFGPLAVSYPLWLWIVLALIAAALIALVVRVYRISRQRKVFLRDLAERSTALAPYHQFQKDLRQITRDLPVAHLEKWEPQLADQTIDRLDSAYRWFLAREFKVPALKWSAALVHKEIRKIHRRLFKQAEQSLLIADRELRRAKKNSAKISLSDFQHLLEIVRKAADVIRLHRSQESRR